MTRCNVNELVLHKYSKYVAENTGKVPLTELMGKGTDLIQEMIEYQMDVMGSTGKAWCMLFEIGFGRFGVDCIIYE